MVNVPGDGFTLRLLGLETCPVSGVSIGHRLNSLYAWDKKGSLLQALWIPGRNIRTVVTDAADGRPTIIAAESLDEDERPRAVHVRAIDVRTGVVRWRRKEKLHFGAACYSLGGAGGADNAERAARANRIVVRLNAPHGAHLFDVDTGARLRASDRELAPRNAKQRKKAPASFVSPPVDLLPVYTLRRDPPGSRLQDDPEDAGVEAARRAFFFGPSSARRAWSRAPCTPTVWQLVRELRALESKPDVSKMPPHLAEPDMPPDVQALLAADSALLRSRWRLDTKLAPGLAKKAKEGGVPKPVVVIGGEAYPENTQRPKLLCAQATDWGDRLGTFDGFGYQGPFPIATLLSDACWSILEGRPSGEGNGDQNCAQMVPIIRRVLEAAQEGVAD